MSPTLETEDGRYAAKTCRVEQMLQQWAREDAALDAEVIDLRDRKPVKA